MCQTVGLNRRETQTNLGKVSSRLVGVLGRLGSLGVGLFESFRDVGLGRLRNFSLGRLLLEGTFSESADGAHEHRQHQYKPRACEF